MLVLQPVTDGLFPLARRSPCAFTVWTSMKLKSRMFDDVCSITCHLAHVVLFTRSMHDPESALTKIDKE